MEPVNAEELLLGTVEAEMNGESLVTVIQAPDRPSVAPEELVKIQSRIPGIDEVVESAKGYVYATRSGTFQVKITEGEPALGEEVILLKREFLNGSVSTDEEPWRRMGYEDLRKSGNKPPNVGALCVLGKMYIADYNQEEISRDENSARLLLRYATEQQQSPSPDCAYKYGSLMRDGDLQNNPPKFRYDYAAAEKWLRYAAEGGHYFGMISYADMLELKRQYREAERWLKKAIEIEPDVLRSIGSAEGQLKRVRKKMR